MQKTILIKDGTGQEVLDQLNGAFESITTDFMGSSEPQPSYPGMKWIDTSGENPVLKLRNVANNAWIEEAQLQDGTFIVSINSKKLTDEDLNDLTIEGTYFAAANNSVTNKPTDCNAFSVNVKRCTNTSYVQDLTEDTGKKWTRIVSEGAAADWVLCYSSQFNTAANLDLSNITVAGITKIRSAVKSCDADSIYQKNVHCNSATIELQDGCSSYDITISGNTTINFSTAYLTEATTSKRTFELLINVSSLGSITFNNVSWVDSNTPSISATGTYLFAFTSYPSWTNWIGNMQGKV